MSTAITRNIVAIALSGPILLLNASTNAQDLRSLAKAVISGQTPSVINYSQEYDHQDGSPVYDSATYALSSDSNAVYFDAINHWYGSGAQEFDLAIVGDDMFAASRGGDDNGGNNGAGGGGGASDPTNAALHIMAEWEWQRLNDNQGNLIAFKLSPFIPINLGQQQLLFNFEIPLPQHAGLTGLNHSSGIGDSRLKVFWLIPTGRERVRAMAPSIDAVAPTGDEDRGLGGGQWITMPNVVLAVQPTKNWSMYPFFRYVHANEVLSNLVPDLPLPEEDNLFGTSDLRAFNLEWINVLQLEEAYFDWIELTPDYFKNFTANRAETFTMKYTAAKELRDGLFMILDFWHPVGGSHTHDYSFKIRLDWYPQTNGARCGRCRGRGCGSCCRR